MKTWTIGAAVIAFALTGCASAPEQVEPPAETPNVGMEFCEEFAHGLVPYTDFVDASMRDPVVEGDYKTQQQHIRELHDLVPPEGAAALTQYGDFIDQIDTIIAGGGTGTLTSETFKTGVVETIGYCADDVGYSAGF